MAEIFISYKSERRPAARHLAKVFGAYGYDVWYDYGLIPGDDFEPRLMAEMAAAKVIVVLWCGMATGSPWVNKEAREAKREGKYLPCRIESTALPKEFAAADTINLTEWDGAPRSHMIDRLLGDVARRIGREPAMNFGRLRELDEDWRGYGAPSLAQFALGKALTPGAQTPSPAVPSAVRTLGPLPAGLSPNLAQHWANAQQGDAAALFEVAWNYDAGSGGLPKNDNEAVRLYKLAADQGNAAAHNNLGVMHENGRGGLPKNDDEAARLYKLALDQGNADAQNNLGGMYANGRGGLPKNDNEAVRLYKSAADQGNAEAQTSLGVMFANGRGGLPKNDNEALRLFRLAADQGSASAQANLGFMYEIGRGGLPKDDKEAVRLYKLAARQNNEWAQNVLTGRGESW